MPWLLQTNKYPRILQRADQWLNAKPNRYETALQCSFAFNVLLIGFSCNGYARHIKQEQKKIKVKPFDSDNALYNDINVLQQYKPVTEPREPGYVIGGDIHLAKTNNDKSKIINQYKYSDKTQYDTQQNNA